MPSWVECENHHPGGRCRDAAIELATHHALARCSRKGCGAPRYYRLRQDYPGKGQVEYILERVIRFYSEQRVEDEQYDPMAFLLRRCDNGQVAVWPFYWTVNRNGIWHVGQFPPLLNLEDITKLHEDLQTRTV